MTAPPPPRPASRRRRPLAAPRRGRPSPSREPADASTTCCGTRPRRPPGCSAPTARSCTCSTRRRAGSGSRTTPGIAELGPDHWIRDARASRSGSGCSAGRSRTGGSSSPATTWPTTELRPRRHDRTGSSTRSASSRWSSRRWSPATRCSGRWARSRPRGDAFTAPAGRRSSARSPTTRRSRWPTPASSTSSPAPRRRSRASADIERSLRELGTRISGARDPGAVVQNTIDEALRLLGGDGARIDIVDPEVRLLARHVLGRRGADPRGGLAGRPGRHARGRRVGPRRRSTGQTYISRDYLTDEHSSTATDPTRTRGARASAASSPRR